MAYIVVMEDDEAIGLAMQIHLQGDGHRVDRCANGAVGMRAVDRERPDVIFLDIRMPELDGTAVIQLLRERGLAGRTIVVSAYTEAYMKDYVARYGAAGYITKPFDNWELTAAAERVLAAGATG
jgi:DNA-binding response OmpR family regulator